MRIGPHPVQSHVLCYADGHFHDEQPGIHIACRTDGHLLNSQRMLASTRVSTNTVHDLLFADDCALNTETEEDMQRSMDLFATGCAKFGLKINAAKIVVMHQPPPSAEYNAPRINGNGANSKMWKPLLIWEARCHTTRESMKRSVKTGAAIYEANRITAAKAKRAARKLPTVDAQALPTCPRCQRILRTRIGLVGHLRTQCTSNTSNCANPPSDFPTLTPGINSITPTIIETTPQYSSPVTPTNATTTTSDGDALLNYPHCDRTFTSRIGLVGHLRIHRTETGESVPEHQYTVEITASTALSVLAHSLITWVYLVTCASMTANELANQLANIPVAGVDISVENCWCQLRDTIQSTALNVLGRARHQHQDCLLPKSPPCTATAAGDAGGLDDAQSRGNPRVHGPKRMEELLHRHQGCLRTSLQRRHHILSADGRTLLTEKTQILTRWAEHFQSVLNQPSTISDAAIDRQPEVEINADLDLLPSHQETIRAVQQLSSGKAPGSDAIPAEIFKHGGPQLTSQLTVLFQEMWHQGKVPHNLRDATIVHLHKKKGNRHFYDNHQGILLLNIAGKIFARILFNRLNAHLE
ncbi:unnamed protein product [Schistocephalus solidus]|uniref:C2H2-type domain-containing protein n=1 Tax=Schistocephalus solidus TaxID=70667 RepID=A0A183T0L8_SCHSO|nr:unnamed protein product [Schistocephalus solidus]